MVRQMQQAGWMSAVSDGQAGEGGGVAAGTVASATSGRGAPGGPAARQEVAAGRRRLLLAGGGVLLLAGCGSVHDDPYYLDDRNDGAVAANLAAQGYAVHTASDVGKLAEDNNTAAIQVLRQAGRDIGSVLAMCVNLLNPSVIVLGGRLASAGEHVIAGVREQVYFRSTPLATQHLVIVGSAAADMAGVRGASMLVIGTTM